MLAFIYVTTHTHRYADARLPFFSFGITSRDARGLCKEHFDTEKCAREKMRMEHACIAFITFCHRLCADSADRLCASRGHLLCADSGHRLCADSRHHWCADSGHMQIVVIIGVQIEVISCVQTAVIACVQIVVAHWCADSGHRLCACGMLVRFCGMHVCL